MECEGTSRQTDGFRSEHRTWTVTISALQAENTGLKSIIIPVSGYQSLGCFFCFLGGGVGLGMKSASIQQSGYIPGPKLYIWHHEWKPLKYFSLRLYIQTLSLTLNSKIFKHPPCTVLLFFMPFVIQMWCLMPGACSLSEPCMSLKLTWLKPLLEER